MLFKVQYELIIKYVNGNVVLFGIYETYGEAFDAACLEASSQLPTETVSAFQITKTFANKAVDASSAGA